MTAAWPLRVASVGEAQCTAAMGLGMFACSWNSAKGAKASLGSLELALRDLVQCHGETACGMMRTLVS